MRNLAAMPVAAGNGALRLRTASVRPSRRLALVSSIALVVAVLVAGAVAERTATRGATATPPGELPFALQAVAQQAAGSSSARFAVRRHGGVLVASGGGIASTFSASGVRASVPGGTLALRLSAFGRGTA